VSTSRSTTRLVDHPDFGQLVRTVSDSVGLLPTWVEKDYWLVRVLEALVQAPELAARFVFKGGTSLSKAWKLIDRFSEDIDLLLTGQNYGPMPALRNERERLFKAVRKAIESATPLRLPLTGLSEAEKRLYYLRSDTHGRLRYPLRKAELSPGATSEEWLLVEAGFRGGSRPWTSVSIRSYMGEYVSSRPELATVARQYAADVEPINVPVLSAERTFVEKLLAVHTAATGDWTRLQVRHYYDLAQLYRNHPDVRRCLENPIAFQTLLAEAVEVSNTHWGANLNIATLDLGRSPALDPPPELRRMVAERWRGEEVLYPKGQPPLAEVLDVLAELRGKLATLLPRGTGDDDHRHEGSSKLQQ
jgi:predicted nucleotidyltransferase component of viral defense system